MVNVKTKKEFVRGECMTRNPVPARRSHTVKDALVKLD
jgi:hypothetical protein